MAESDVCLILEGSYPYVVGGVSTWTHHLIRSMSDLTFSIVYVGVSKHQVQRMEYKLPENVRQFYEVYLLDPVVVKGASRRVSKSAWKEIERFVQEMEEGNHDRFHKVVNLLTSGDTPLLTPYDILYSKRFWNIITGIYERHFPSLSFIDFFWTSRFLMLPLFQLLYAPIPQAKVYHATCTGYAGMLAALGHKRYDAPMVLTEHGIYTRERMIEISQAAYIYNENVVDYVPRRELGLLQNLWMSKFRVLARMAYEAADPVVTLYEGNRLRQIDDGADPEKCRIIPNGIDIARFAGLSDLRPQLKDGARHVALVGRISPIKDVKTFIRTARIVVDALPDTIFYVLGTPDEDVEYYEECRALAELMELGDRLRFMGNVDMSKYYPKLDCVVLTSVSEAQPFVVIEAMAVGVPCVTTNVGACSELLFGRTKEDRALGEAGIVTNVNSPEETAKGVIRILENEALWTSMSRVGRERSFRYYKRDAVINEYRETYRQLISQAERGSGASSGRAGVGA